MEKCKQTRKHKYTFTTNLFVTVQLLEETLAVLSLGKLCEDHGYSSYEWVSGHKPRLANRRRQCIHNGQFRTSSRSRVIYQFWKLFVFYTDIAGFFFNKSSPRAKWRICSTRLVRITLRNPKQKKWEDKGDPDDRMRDLLEWLEESTDNLKDTDVHVPVHMSQDSDSEPPTKVVSKSRKRSIETHFPKRPKLRSLLANQNDKHRWKSRTTCERRYFSSIATIGIEKWWSDSMECSCFLRSVQDLLADGENSLCKRSIKTSSILARKFYQESFFGYEMTAVGIWKGVRIWKIWTHQTFILEEWTREKCWYHEKETEFIFPAADGTATLSGRYYDFRKPTLSREQTVRIEDFSGWPWGEPGESQPTESTDDAEVHADLWSIPGDFIVITMNIEFKSMCRRKKHCLFHWNTMMEQGLLTLIWTSWKRNVSMTRNLSDS